MSVSAAERHASVLPPAEQYLEVGFNYRMTDMQAAVGLVQLGRLDEMVAPPPCAGRRATSTMLSDVPGVRCGPRPRVRARPTTSRSGCELESDVPVGRERAAGSPGREGHLGPAGASWPPTASPPTRTSRRRLLPVTERLTDETLILPLFHQMTDEEQGRVIQVDD